jgi:hypothetical protein
MRAAVPHYRSCGFFSRAGDRTRTGDVQLGKLAFYQLNYARKAQRLNVAGTSSVLN